MERYRFVIVAGRVGGRIRRCRHCGQLDIAVVLTSQESSAVLLRIPVHTVVRIFGTICDTTTWILGASRHAVWQCLYHSIVWQENDVSHGHRRTRALFSCQGRCVWYKGSLRYGKQPYLWKDLFFKRIVRIFDTVLSLLCFSFILSSHYLDCHNLWRRCLLWCSAISHGRTICLLQERVVGQGICEVHGLHPRRGGHLLWARMGRRGRGWFVAEFVRFVYIDQFTVLVGRRNSAALEGFRYGRALL